ncbi:glycosyltransferase family 39 protein [Nonomuraea sp. NPDC000554]|uniref:glycosyltransferase family 39 protein n=1 Tax=Nonomuraea sp. NPDC000554 TaxID=3154259 RepID=UPI00332FCAE6
MLNIVARPKARQAGLGLLLLATAVLYVWGLGASGWANGFYSAAVQAGSQSWKAFFFGASDAAGAITVDKTPASLWPMALSVRLFGLNSWSILVPQALMGVGAVAVVYATVRRLFPAWAGLLAGAVMALTPVAVLMFRFNNPDALLVLLLTVAGYCVVRAQERGATRWLVLAGVAVGFAFLAKMLQAFLVLPGFALVYLVTGPVAVWRRVRQLLLAGLAMVVSAGWWVAVVALVPAADRPYIGGSQGNSVLELALGYNGIGRLNGADYGGLGNLNQQAGWLRLFDTEASGQISWLLPAALVLLAVATWVTRRAPRADPVRAAFWTWGSWLVATGLVFSLMQGIFHAYYTVALAPAIAVLVGMGIALLWERRAFAASAVVTAVTAVWAYVLLSRSAEWNSWLGLVVGVVGLAAAGVLAFGRLLAVPRWRGWVLGGVVAALLAGLAGPAAYALDTASSPHTGAIPAAGPSTGGFGGRPGGAFQRGAFRQPPGGFRQPGGGVRGPGADGGFRGTGGRPGGMGGLLEAGTPGAELTALLEGGASGYTWVAATVGSNNAAGYQLATGSPVMAVGGFNGTDPAPTLERFQRYVAEKKIHYFIGAGMGGGRNTGRGTGGLGGTGGTGGSGGSDEAVRIASWVGSTFTATTVAGVTVYDLTR